jgi:cytokinesis protein
MDSIFGRKKANRARGVSLSNDSELDERAIPYDRLTSSGRPPIPVSPNGRPTASMISAPMTNPTLTTEGTDLNIHSSLLRDRRRTPDSSVTDGDWSGTTLATNGAGPSRNTLTSDSRASLNTVSSGGSRPRERRRETDNSSVASGTTSYSTHHTAGSPTKSGNMGDFGNLSRPSSPRPTSSHRPTSSATLKSDFYRVSAAAAAKYAPSLATAASDISAHLAHFHLPHRNDEEFVFPRPENANDIETMFAQVKATRGMPENFNPNLDAKWTLVYQHELARWEDERRKMSEVKRQTAQGVVLGSPYSKDSPEWYLKKFMDMMITAKHLASLAVSLRTFPIG